VVEPFLRTVVVAGGLIEQVGTDAQREEFLPPIMAGEAIWALAWTEGHSRYDLNNVATAAVRNGDTYVLNGAKACHRCAVLDKLIVSARYWRPARSCRC
jgi:alkylation response protein AidB-like acyl-CoA dehydrogenase